MIRHVLCLALLPALVSHAAEPTEADLAKASALVQRATEQAEKKTSGNTIQLPNIDALPTPIVAVRPTLDVEALARKMSEQIERPTPPTLFAFVSFSMPKASLLRLVEDAERSGAILVLRGMVNGTLDETFAAAHSIIGQRQVQWIIDPRLYHRFEIQAVPSYVLTQSELPKDDSTCGSTTVCADSAYAKVTGDVTVSYALEAISRLAPEFDHLSTAFSQRGISK